MEMLPIAIIFTTVDDEKKAKELAQGLLKERLAACISLWSAESRYWWNNAIEEAQEVVLKIKTSPEKVEEVVAFLKENHPYELPEILVLEGKAEGEYGKWVRKETRTE